MGYLGASIVVIFSVQIFLFWYWMSKMISSVFSVLNKFDSLIANMICHQEKLRREFEEFLKDVEKFKEGLKEIKEKEIVEKVEEKKGIKVKFGLGKFQ